MNQEEHQKTVHVLLNEIFYIDGKINPISAGITLKLDEWDEEKAGIFDSLRDSL